MDYVRYNGLLWPAKGPLWWKLGPPEKSGVGICPPLTTPNGASVYKPLHLFIKRKAFLLIFLVPLLTSFPKTPSAALQTIFQKIIPSIFYIVKF